MDYHHVNIHSRGEAPFDFYPYNPSQVAGWIFVILFAIGTLTHLFLLFCYRAWYFTPFVLGCLAETGGYYGRAWAHNNRRQSNPYILQLFLIIGATPLLSASIYMSLARLTRTLDAVDIAPFRIGWISKIYILIDIACLGLQIAGTVIEAYGGSGQQRTALNCVAGGLIFQLIAFAVFILLAWTIHARLNREATSISMSSRVKWRKYFWALYVSSVLVMLRNLVRIIEFLQGSDGYITGHEIFLYVFDACPMFLVVLLLAVVHPGRLRRVVSRVLKRDADTESMQRLQDGTKDTI